MSDVNAAQLDSRIRTAHSPDLPTMRRAALTICRSALVDAGDPGEVRDVLDALGIYEPLRHDMEKT